MPRPALEIRYWKKVDKRGPDECWPWLGAQAGKSPRGAFWNGQGRVRGKVLYAHRFGYELAYGPIPQGLVVDHTCRNGLCQNPRHLRAVTQQVNCTENSSSFAARNAAKTHCAKGHPYAGKNLAVLLVPVKKTHNGHPTDRLQKQRVCLTCYPHNRNHPKRIA